MEDGNAKQRSHKMMVSNRRTCMVSGVCDVLSFDLSEIILKTDLGILNIKGNQLHVNRLTLEKGEVDIEGNIDSLFYTQMQNRGESDDSFLRKLFR